MIARFIAWFLGLSEKTQWIGLAVTATVTVLLALYVAGGLQSCVDRKHDLAADQDVYDVLKKVDELERKNEVLRQAYKDQEVLLRESEEREMLYRRVATMYGAQGEEIDREIAEFQKRRRSTGAVDAGPVDDTALLERLRRKSATKRK